MGVAARGAPPDTTAEDKCLIGLAHLTLHLNSLLLYPHPLRTTPAYRVAS